MEGTSGRRQSMLKRTGLVIGLAVTAVVLILVLVGCASSTTPSSSAKTSDQAASTTQGYANPDLLVDTDWLAKNLSDPNLRIVDVRKPDDYKAGHIKGAVNIPLEATFLPNGPTGMVGTPEQVSEALGAKGIGNDNKVVVYDIGKDMRASHMFWTLEYFGDKKVSVLNGGFKKWQRENKDISTTEPTVTPAKFSAKADSAKIATLDEMKAAVYKDGAVIVDSRSPAEYTGDALYSKRGGHVPSAVNIDYVTLFNPDDTFKSATDLAKLYQEKGVTKDKEVHAY